MDEKPDERRSFEVGGDTSSPVGPGHGYEAEPSFDRSHLDFGHYAGLSIEELAKLDPDYLIWLARHPSGARYRGEIEKILGRFPLVPGG